MSKFLKKMQPVSIGQSAKCVALVNALIEKKAIRIEAPRIYLYPELLFGPDKGKTFVKNLFFYCRIKNLVRPKDKLSIRNIETDLEIGTYSPE